MGTEGDANGTGGVNIGDALVVARSVGGLANPPVPASVADVNLSNQLNIGDALLVVQAYTGQFSLNAELQRQLPLFQGEKILNASVEFDGQSEHVYFYTASGLKVRAETLLQR